MPPHCDSMDGPVVTASRKALQAENVDLVLPYVPKEDEAEVIEAFNRVTAIRKYGLQVQEVTDLYFFETVVRIHRAGEGAPFTGLKPAGLDEGPVIPIAEHAIESGSPDALIRMLVDTLTTEILKRFERVMYLKPHTDESVDAQREYVEAMLGLQVYSHKLYLGIKGVPELELHHHGEMESL